MNISQAFTTALEHHQAGRLAEAEVIYRQILAVQPRHADALQYLGVLAQQVGRAGLAIDLIRRAIVIDPGSAAAHSNLGEALRSAGRPDEAITAYRRAAELDPHLAAARSNLGNVLSELGRFDEAERAYRRALALRGDDAGVWNDLGLALAALGRLDDAVAVYRRALQLRPDLAEVETNLSNALKDQGLLDEAIDAARRAVELRPGHPGVSSNLIFTLQFQPGRNEEALEEEQRRWNRQFGEPLRRGIRPHANERDVSRRLKIGYVSPYFGSNVLGRNILPLFLGHDRQEFEIVCYSGVERPDDLTGEFRQRADHWQETNGVSDEAFAEMIRQDRVDILVDLTLHAMRNRLPVFAYQPAPVQVSFAAYPGSSGLEAIQHRISDRYLERMKDEGGGMKTDEAGRVFLIDSFWCYDPCGVDVAVNGLPALENGRVTFGSLNDFAKVNEPLLKLWARVLSAVKDSRLVLLSAAGSHRQRVRDFLERDGIAAERVEFVERRPHGEYLKLYQQLDLVLDAFPYGGHTTALDAFWMGVPVVSLVGGRRVSRAGWSHLSNLGLESLAAFSEDEYVSIAACLARDLPRLAELRAILRRRMESSVLMDAPRFVRNIEIAYRAMWRRWCAEQQP